MNVNVLPIDGDVLANSTIRLTLGLYSFFLYFQVIVGFLTQVSSRR